jgi:hypothetical protein
VLALFANGRIEQWLHCVCLSPHDMCSPALVPRIARQLRRFHGIDVALPKQPLTPWGVIRAWLKQARQLTFTDPVKQVWAVRCLPLEARGTWTCHTHTQHQPCTTLPRKQHTPGNLCSH